MSENKSKSRIGLTPHLTIKGEGASAASAFFQTAFGAVEVARAVADDGKRLYHCTVRINGDELFFSDDFPEMTGGPSPDPAGFVLNLQVDDADAWFSRAIAAGCVEVHPLADQFWGERYGQVRDPFGLRWGIAQTIA